MSPFLCLSTAEIAEELDVQGHGIPVTVATYMGMNALHDAGGLGMLPVYLYLPWEVKMDVVMPDTVQGNSFIHAFQFLGLVF